MRFCSTPRCRNKVHAGRCATCQASASASAPKASAHARGYTRAWDRFRLQQFPALLLDAGIVPACGARLQGGPSPYSTCAADGVVTFHEKPREPAHVAVEEFHAQLLAVLGPGGEGGALTPGRPALADGLRVAMMDVQGYPGVRFVSAGPR